MLFIFVGNPLYLEHVGKPELTGPRLLKECALHFARKDLEIPNAFVPNI